MNCCCWKQRQKNRTKRRRYIVSFIARHFITETFSSWVTSEHQTHLVGSARQSKNYGQQSGESDDERVRAHTWANTWTTKTFTKELILFAYFRIAKMPFRNHPTIHAFGRFLSIWKNVKVWLAKYFSSFCRIPPTAQESSGAKLCNALKHPHTSKTHMFHGDVFSPFFWWWFIHRIHKFRMPNTFRFGTWFTHTHKVNNKYRIERLSIRNEFHKKIRRQRRMRMRWRKERKISKVKRKWDMAATKYSLSQT